MGVFVGSDCNNKALRDETGVKRGDTVGLETLHGLSRALCRIASYTSCSPPCHTGRRGTGMSLRQDVVCRRRRAPLRCLSAVLEQFWSNLAFDCAPVEL